MIYARFEIGRHIVDCEGRTPSEAFLQTGTDAEFYDVAKMAAEEGALDDARSLMEEFVQPAWEGRLTLEKLRTMNYCFSRGPFRCIEAFSDVPLESTAQPAENHEPAVPYSFSDSNKNESESIGGNNAAQNNANNSKNQNREKKNSCGSFVIGVLIFIAIICFCSSCLGCSICSSGSSTSGKTASKCQVCKKRDAVIYYAGYNMCRYCYNMISDAAAGYR